MQYIKHDVDRHGLSPSPKLVLKIAPDLIDSELNDIAQVCIFNFKIVYLKLSNLPKILSLRFLGGPG